MDVARHDAALGAVLGALVGDAAGAVLEFFSRPITARDVEHALTMPGGGCWGVAPGQVTDDGELTMSLLHALADASLPPRVAAGKRYAAWIASRPFDVGMTTMRSLGCLRSPRWGARLADDPNIPLCDLMTDAAREQCMDSKANGSMMRATPLGVWGALRSDAEVIAAARDDAALSHPNAACVASTAAYVLAVAWLVRHPGDVPGAVAAAAAYLEQAGNAEALTWMRDARAGVIVPYQPMDGFVRIAFTHAFRHLLRETPYVDALRETLAGGGDTDTNACIVGGLVGARWGASAVPEPMRRAVLDSDHARGRRVRPDDLHPRHVPSLVRALLNQGS